MAARRFEERDREALRDLYLETRKRIFTWLDGSVLDQGDFDKDTEEESIWVYENKAELVGFVSAQVADRFIHHLFVLPQFSKQGLGSLLLETCLDEIGYPAQLKCVSENIGALKFYQSQGWRTCSKAMGIDGEYHLMEICRTQQSD